MNFCVSLPTWTSLAKDFLSFQSCTVEIKKIQMEHSFRLERNKVKKTVDNNIVLPLLVFVFGKKRALYGCVLACSVASVVSESL